MTQIFVFGLIALILGATGAQAVPANVILEKGTREISLEEALAGVKAGDVVVLGEEHGTSVQSRQQLQVLETIRLKGLRVSVGMEFFSYPQQKQVDSWRQGHLSETEFLKAVEWGQGLTFDAYRPQVQFPYLENEFVLALNAPRKLTSKISKSGLSSLSEEESQMMPPGFQLGNASYFERFRRTMEDGGHSLPAEAVDRYFAAQSTWDDTMAWQATELMKAHPDQVLVIIVGEFHVQYGGGLPDRLKARGARVLTFSLVNLFGMTDSEQKEAVRPSSQDGARADFVWTSRFSRPQP